MRRGMCGEGRGRVRPCKQELALNFMADGLPAGKNWNVLSAFEMLAPCRLVLLLRVDAVALSLSYRASRGSVVTTHHRFWVVFIAPNL